MDRSVVVRLAALTTPFNVAFAHAGKSVRDLKGEITGAVRTNKKDMTELGQTSAIAGAALLGGFALAGRASMRFDKQMSHVQAATHETEAAMADLGDAAIDAGKRTSFSATEAAQGIEELAKAGVSTKDILAGGLNGALDLAAAGSLGVAESAEIAASAMVQFDLRGKDVVHIADLLAAGAGKAQGSVQDMGLALSYVGPVAGQMGISIEETAGSIALLASNGIKGEKAGTNLRGVLMALTAPSNKAADAMRQYGIDVYDAQGKFIGLRGVAEELQTGLGGVDEATRNAALGQIFGNEQMTGAITLYKSGAEGVDEWTSKVNDAGYAQETAAAKTDNLAGDLERLGGAIDTALIQGGSTATGVLRGLTQATEGTVEAFSSAPDPVQGTLIALMGLGGVALTAGGGFLALAPRIVETRDAVKTLGERAPRTTRMLTGLARAGGGLLVLGASVTVLTQLSEALARANDQRLETAGLGDELRRLGETGATSGELLNVYGGDLEEFGRRSAAALDDGLYAKLERAVTFGSGTEVDATINNLRDIDRELANMVESGNATAAVDAFNAFAQVHVDSGGDLRAFREQFTLLDKALEGYGIDAQIAAEKTTAVGGSLEGTAPQVDAAAGRLEALASSLGYSVEEMDAFHDMVDELGQAVAGFSDPVDAYVDVLDRKTKADEEAAQRAADAHNASIAEQVEAIQRGYQARIDDARESGESNDKLIQQLEDRRDTEIESLQAGEKSWEDFSGAVKVSTGEYLAELEKQVQDQRDWKSNIIKLSTQVSEGTLQQLIAMGQEGAPIVAAFAKGTADEVAKLEKWLPQTTEAAGAGMATDMLETGVLLQKIAKESGQGTADRYAEELAKGEITVAEIAARYQLSLEEKIGPAADSTRGKFDLLRTSIENIPNSIQAPVRTPGLMEAIDQTTDLRDTINSLSDKDVRIGVSYMDAFTQSGGPGNVPFRRAGGGPVWGAGTATSDSIPALLSDGEYVQRTAAVDHYGLPVMDALNRKAIPREALAGFATGGHVSRITADYDSLGLGATLAGLQRRAEAGAAAWLRENGGGPINPGLAGALDWARSQAGKPYVWGGVGPGGYDCSGFMSAITNVIRGQRPHQRLFATASFAGGRTAGGYEPGLGGAMTIGVVQGNPGHMAGTLNGTNVESRGGQGVVVGPSARGSRDRLFDQHYRLPGYAGGGHVEGDPAFDLLNPRGRHYDPAKRKHVLGDATLFDWGGDWETGTLGLNLSGGTEKVLDPRMARAFDGLTGAIKGYASGGQVRGGDGVNAPSLFDFSTAMAAYSSRPEAVTSRDYTRLIYAHADAIDRVREAERALRQSRAKNTWRTTEDGSRVRATFYSDGLRREIAAAERDLHRAKMDAAQALQERRGAYAARGNTGFSVSQFAGALEQAHAAQDAYERNLAKVEKTVGEALTDFIAGLGEQGADIAEAIATKRGPQVRRMIAALREQMSRQTGITDRDLPLVERVYADGRPTATLPGSVPQPVYATGPARNVEQRPITFHLEAAPYIPTERQLLGMVARAEDLLDL